MLQDIWNRHSERPLSSWCFLPLNLLCPPPTRPCHLTVAISPQPEGTFRELKHSLSNVRTERSSHRASAAVQDTSETLRAATWHPVPRHHGALRSLGKEAKLSIHLPYTNRHMELRGMDRLLEVRLCDYGHILPAVSTVKPPPVSAPQSLQQ